MPLLLVGVLCIQGSFLEHIEVLKKVGDELEKSWNLKVVEVRKPEHLVGLRGLIIPGGESTTLSVFLSKDGFQESLKKLIFGDEKQCVVWGTCAGLILLANELTEQRKVGQVTVSVL